MRRHWDNCITHFDSKVTDFVNEYFARADRRCVLVAGAGFDPRARIIAEQLAPAMGDRLYALLIREERGDSAVKLQQYADNNESKLRELIDNVNVVQIDIFAEDGAAIGGAKLSSALTNFVWPDNITDVVLDMSALSIGVGFPAARLLLDKCETSQDMNFHLMIASNPELDSKIIGEPADDAINVRGYAGNTVDSTSDSIARIWLPQLSHGRGEALEKIRAANERVYKICPILPFPASNPRRADELIDEFGTQLREQWLVDPRDIIYVSESNPLDSYRTISTLKTRYERSMEGIYAPQLILSPIGSKVMAAGAMMAAINHELTVQYVEALRYEIDTSHLGPMQPPTVVHTWLHGPIYANYDL